MGKNKSVTIGYRYYFGLHMGIGRGPVDELVELKVADETAWTGSITDNGSFRINAGNLFGGDKGEGGIEGRAYALFGAATQAVYAPLAAMLGGLVPAFRGRTTIFFDGLVCSMNPYPKAWAWRVRRILKGWDGDTWYPSRAVISMASGTIKAMNPAHILVEAATNRDWGRGLNRAQLDLDAYQAVADTLYSEGFGLCFRWTRQDSISSFIQLILDHIGAVQAVDRRTGLLTIKLIRQDYEYEDLPLFDFSNGLLAVEDYETAAFDSATNTIIVTYRDPVTNEDRSTAPLQNLAAVQTSGFTITTSTEYFALPTYELAARCAERDLQISMGSMRRMTLVMDRRFARNLKPGSVFRVSAPAYGIGDLIVRTGKIDDAAMDDGHLRAVVVQDLFGMPAQSYIEPTSNQWQAPDKTVRAVTTRRFWESGYRDVYLLKDQANLNLVDSTAGYVSSVAIKPSGLLLNYKLWTSTTASVVGYQEQDAGDWTPSGLLSTVMPAQAGATTITLYEGFSLTDVVVGSSARVNSEELIVTAIDTETGVCTFERGALDTIPQEHAMDSRVWFTYQAMAEDPVEYAQGQTIYARLLSHSNAGDLPLAQASPDSLQLIARQAKPYPPGNVRINNMAIGSILPVARPAVLTWAHRDRVMQGDQLFGHTAGNLGPETGVTYTVRVLLANGTVKRTVTGLTTTTWTYDSTMMAADGIDDVFGVCRIQLWAVRDTIQSWQIYDLPIIVIKPGLGLSLGYSLGGE